MAVQYVLCTSGFVDVPYGVGDASKALRLKLVTGGRANQGEDRKYLL